MQDILHANIFFFITAISVVVITILLAVLLVYGIKFIRNLSDISNEVKDEAHEYVEASRNLREKISSLPFVSFFTGSKRTRKSKRD
jgi:ABC-type multidrug transport system fused ATPase/permease subunit